MVAGLSAASWSAPSEPTTAVSITVITSDESHPVRVGRMNLNNSRVRTSLVGHSCVGTSAAALVSCGSEERLIRAIDASRGNVLPCERTASG
eukprot:scaffold165816_cov33-Tisochrysis_lutea.AAC.5